MCMIQWDVLAPLERLCGASMINNLAPILVSHLITKIGELQEQHGLSVLMTEQNFHQATKIADRGYILVEGRIAFEGHSTAELSEHELVKKYYLSV